jgi:hypothetical protein
MYSSLNNEMLERNHGNGKNTGFINGMQIFQKNYSEVSITLT